MQLTNAEIYKVFAMYWDGESNPGKNCTSCQVLTPDGVRQLIGFAFGKIYVKTWPEYISPSSAYFTYNQDECKLLLTPLDKITDEHAIEVCKFVYNGSASLPEQYYIGRMTVEFHYLNYSWADDTYDTAKNREFISSIRPWAAIAMNEYLKSKYYAVPLWLGFNHWANGKTAIELRIAIEKPTT